MPAFKDKHGREWLISLDAPKIAAVRRECQIDLVAIEDKVYERLYDDPVLLVNTLWVLCRSQAQTRNVSDEQFGEALVGDAIDDATKSLIDAIVDFCPSRKREVLRTLVAKTTKIRDLAMERALARVNDPALQEQILTAIDQQTEEALRNALTQFSGATNSPASSTSTPTDEPSAS